MDSSAFFVAWLCALAWIFGVVGISVIYRRWRGKPVFPRVPRTAIFAETWRSGRSLKNLLTSIGGARNALMVYVADGRLTVIPMFPFTLMFLPEIYGLEVAAPLPVVTATPVDRMWTKRVLVSIEGDKPMRLELHLADRDGFMAAVAGKRARQPGRVAESGKPRRPSVGQVLTRAFLCLWGVGALAFGVSALRDDLQFRREGIGVEGIIADHTGTVGDKNDSGIVHYAVAGRTYSLVSLRGSGIYRLGDKVGVHYLPGDPGSAREDEGLSFDLLFLCLGAVALALSLAWGLIAGFFRRLVYQ